MFDWLKKLIRKDPEMKKLFALFLCLCLMVGIVPAFAETAAEEKYPVRFDLRDICDRYCSA